MLLAQNKIAGVSHLLAAALRNGASLETIGRRLQDAISGTYAPRASWSDREYDVAFLVKAIGGPRLLYALQKAEGYPSLSTLRRRKPIPELVISIGVPSATEMTDNIAEFLGVRGRLPLKNKLIGQVLVIDGVALEEVARFDLKQNNIVGLCREHSGHLKKSVDTILDIEYIAKAVHDDKVSHYGKDGTVIGLTPVTDHENYHIAPLVLSASCKAETGDALANTLNAFIAAYHGSPDGEARHGPIVTIATDGESSFHRMHFTLGLGEDLDRDCEMGRVLYRLRGLNCKTGRNQILTTCDPKHIIK